jgi:hypothetical protein
VGWVEPEAGGRLAARVCRPTEVPVATVLPSGAREWVVALATLAGRQSAQAEGEMALRRRGLLLVPGQRIVAHADPQLGADSYPRDGVR